MASFVTSRVMRFGDCDPAGIAYFPRYFDLLNGVVEEFWGALGFPWQNLFTERRIGVPTVHLESDFRAIARFGDVMTFALTLRQVGSRSLHLGHQVHRDEILLWTASQVLVATSLETHQSIPWPPDVRAALTTCLENSHASHPAAGRLG